MIKGRGANNSAAREFASRRKYVLSNGSIALEGTRLDPSGLYWLVQNCLELESTLSGKLVTTGGYATADFVDGSQVPN